MEINQNNNGHNKEDIQKIIEEYKRKSQIPYYEIIFINEFPDILDDKIGGIPYLPIGEEFPRDSENLLMYPLLQINFKHIELDNFPKKGILIIFISCKIDNYEIKTLYFEDDKMEYQKNLPLIRSDKYNLDFAKKIKLIKKYEYINKYNKEFYLKNFVLGNNYKEDIENLIKNNEIESKKNKKYLENYIGGNLVNITDDYQEDERVIILHFNFDKVFNWYDEDDFIQMKLYIKKKDLINSNFDNLGIELLGIEEETDTEIASIKSFVSEYPTL